MDSVGCDLAIGVGVASGVWTAVDVACSAAGVANVAVLVASGVGTATSLGVVIAAPRRGNNRQADSRIIRTSRRMSSVLDVLLHARLAGRHEEA